MDNERWYIFYIYWFNDGCLSIYMFYAGWWGKGVTEQEPEWMTISKKSCYYVTELIDTIYMEYILKNREKETK